MGFLGITFLIAGVLAPGGAFAVADVLVTANVPVEVLKGEGNGFGAHGEQTHRLPRFAFQRRRGVRRRSE